MGMFSSWVERAYVGAQGVEFEASFAARTLVAGRAVWFYAGKLAWPSGLNFVYARWAVDPTAWWQWVFPLGALAAALGSGRTPLEQAVDSLVRESVVPEIEELFARSLTAYG